jgi:hypothetical protein
MFSAATFPSFTPTAYVAVVMPVLFFAVVLLALFLTLFLVAFRSAKHLSSPWLRGFAQFGATVGVALSVILFAGFLWAMYPRTVRGPVAYAPDGKHVAVVTWAVGPLVVNDDIATVKVRHRSGIFSARVFSGPGYSNDPNDLQVRWIDNDHLLIRYDKWFGYDYSHACTPHAFGVEVTCEPRP